MGSTSSKKVLVVFGATGKQGGSVVKTLLSDSNTAAQFHIKAVTRDVSKDSAKALQALGAECIAVCTPYSLVMSTSALFHAFTDNIHSPCLGRPRRQ